MNTSKKNNQVLPDLVYVIGTGSRWNDNELRFSLRSVEKNLRSFRNIVIVGFKPAFLQNVIHIPAIDIFDSALNADGNMTAKLLLACNTQGLSDNFIFMNDDFIFLQPMEASKIATFHKGDMKSRDRTFWEQQFYRSRLRRTFETLRDRGETTLQYDYHAPMPMNKINFIKVMQQYNYAEGIGLTFRSLYGNTMKVPTEPLTDQKKILYGYYSLEQLTEIAKKSLFLGYNDQALKNSFKIWLNQTFPVKSSFENTDIHDRVIEITNWLSGDQDYRQGVSLFKKYMKGINLIKMLEGVETTFLKEKLLFKLKHALDEQK